MAHAKVFVVIVNWNGKENLQQCLESIQKYPADAPQIVVVDNGSTDQSVQMLRQQFSAVKIIENRTNLGFSKANNEGIRYAGTKGAEYFLVLNNDIIVGKQGWLSQMVNLMEADKSVGMVGCKLLYPDGHIQHAGGFIRISGAGHRGDGEPDHGQYGKVESVDYVTGAALLTKVEVIRRIGMFDEGFTPLYCEDTDLCTRARFCGYKVVYTPNPELIHKHGSSAKTLKKRNSEFYFKRSWIRFFLLNFTGRGIAKRLLRYEALEFLACFADRTQNGLKVRLDYPKLMMLKKAWLENLRNFKEILGLRHQRFSCRKDSL